MKTLKSVQYFVLDEKNDTAECRVTYTDGKQEVFFEDDDLQRVQRQISVQAKLNQNASVYIGPREL